MPKKMLIDATHAEETRVVVVDGNKVEEFDFESQFKRQLAGNIYLAKVTRVEPSLQAAFVDYGGNRHGFLAFSEIHPDYYQIPVADREALMAEEKAYAESLKAEAEAEEEKPKRRRSRAKPKPAAVETEDAVVTAEAAPAEDAADTESPAVAEVETPKVETPDEQTSGDIAGMETIDLGDDDEGSSPMVLVADTPVETPSADDADDEQPQLDARSKDDSIESVAEEDDTDEVRPVRKPRPKRYKIQEVIKVRQVLLIQVVKEERGNKGAALTTYLSLAGRYCVLMPNTARGGGISRKITNAADRKKLKEIAGEMTVPDGAGLIIRTAGAQRTKAEIKRDYEYLQRMWEQIRELTLKSVAPAKIYEEGDLIKRSIRDLYSKEIDEVIVAGEAGYRTAKDFMKMIMPSHAKNVKYYTEQLPLYARYQVEGYLGGMFNPTVQLPSGGYIVIGITEALVAIDVNSGRATKEGSIEQTALKTNLEAADEVARQLRLRDLAGLIVIDFIDMDERKNNSAVEKRFKDKLKTDRARIQVGRISGFGLLEMSRQRLRPGMLEATTQMCSHCHGTGLLRSDDNVSLSILRQLEEEGVRGRSKEVLVKAPITIANFLMNGKREHIGDIEARYGLSVRIECDPTLVSPDFAIEKFKTATRVVPEAAPVVTSTVIMDDDHDIAVEAEVEDNEFAANDENGDGDDKPKRKRRRRRRRRGGNGNGENQQAEGGETNDVSETTPAETPVEAQDAAPVEADAPVVEADAEVAVAEEKPKRTRSRTRRAAPKAEDTAETVVADKAGEADKTAAPEAEEKPAPKKRTRTRKKAEPKPKEAPAEASATDDEVVAEKPKPKRRSRAKPKAAVVTEDAVVTEPAPDVAATPAAEAETPVAVAEVKAEPEHVVEVKPEPTVEVVPDSAPVAEPAPEPVSVAETAPAEVSDEPAKPKRKGWWSLGR
ncbi:ribonuclease E [Yoonia maritima]|uniref:Ribonuclease E n=1 Tax=Yoonia maritima TaxID=1435347 RepID=A0A2T0W1A0_9RHOB|nr:ribonuclease E/G [Yoonia maritima]PRY78713.1 ribonuclease E [Yoonia maritima]